MQRRMTDCGLASAKMYELHAEEVTNSSAALRELVNAYNLCHVSLHTFMNKRKKLIKEDKRSLF